MKVERTTSWIPKLRTRRVAPGMSSAQQGIAPFYRPIPEKALEDLYKKNSSHFDTVEI